MQRGRLYTLFVVAIVALAGCTGALPSGDDGGGDGGDAGAVELVEDPDAVLADAGSYTTTWTMRTSEDGTLVGETTFTTAVNVDDERAAFGMYVTDEGQTRTALETFHADGTTYQRTATDDETSYSVREAAFQDEASFGFGGSSLYGPGTLDGFDYGGTETFDGVAVHRYERDERTPWLTGGDQAGADVQFTDFTYVVLVDDDGLVRSESWEATGTDADGVEYVVAFSYTVTGVGSTAVEDPAWLDEATAETAA